MKYCLNSLSLPHDLPHNPPERSLAAANNPGLVCLLGGGLALLVYLPVIFCIIFPHENIQHLFFDILIALIILLITFLSLAVLNLIDSELRRFPDDIVILWCDRSGLVFEEVVHFRKGLLSGLGVS